MAWAEILAASGAAAEEIPVVIQALKFKIGYVAYIADTAVRGSHVLCAADRVVSTANRLTSGYPHEDCRIPPDYPP